MSTSLSDSKKLPSNMGVEVPSKVSGVVTPEMRGLLFPFSDPLALNFKILLSHEPPYGLLANEDNKDSALAYLKRIGEYERYLMLEKWIFQFYDLFKNWDFLVLDIEGLDAVYEKPLHEMFESDAKINIKIRETIEFRVNALVQTYREIVFDSERYVYVLPTNLRRFTLGILIFASGYFNESIYGEDDTKKKDFTRKLLPTMKKLAQVNDLKDIPKDGTTLPFSNMMVFIENAMINVMDSGQITDIISNSHDNTETATNNISFDYHFASLASSFNTITGEVNLTEILKILSAANKVGNLTNNEQLNSLVKTLNRNNIPAISDAENKNWSKDFVDSWKDFGKQVLEKSTVIKDKQTMVAKWMNNINKNLTQLTDPNLLKNITIGEVSKLLTVADRAIFEKLNIRDLDKLLSRNFTGRALAGLDNLQNSLITKIASKGDLSSTIQQTTMFEAPLQVEGIESPKTIDFNKTMSITSRKGF